MNLIKRNQKGGGEGEGKGGGRGGGGGGEGGGRAGEYIMNFSSSTICVYTIVWRSSHRQ